MKKMVEAGHFLEYADVHGNLYGTSRAAVEKVAQAGCICILDIDVQGVRLVKARSAEMLRDPGEMRRDAARLAAMCLVYRRAGGPGSSRCVACRRRVWRRGLEEGAEGAAKEKGKGERRTPPPPPPSSPGRLRSSTRPRSSSLCARRRWRRDWPRFAAGGTPLHPPPRGPPPSLLRTSP